jgi:hypothetical protein
MRVPTNSKELPTTDEIGNFSKFAVLMFFFIIMFCLGVFHLNKSTPEEGAQATGGTHRNSANRIHPSL